MPTAFLIQPAGVGFEPIRHTISAVVQRLGFDLMSADQLSAGPLSEDFFGALDGADLVIADVSDADGTLMYQLGLVHASDKPVLIISSPGSTRSVPFDLVADRSVIYQNGDMRDDIEFEGDLRAALTALLEAPRAFAGRPRVRTEINQVFVSYSHRDRDVLERLMVHLRPLEREGLIDPWNDTRISAGADWKKEITHALASSRAAILLVTADFLASDFVVDNELPPLLEAAEAVGTQVIPIIVKPCRYVRDRQLRRMQAINDPLRPLVSLPLAQQEQLLDQVAEVVERAIRPARLN